MFRTSKDTPKASQDTTLQFDQELVIMLDDLDIDSQNARDLQDHINDLKNLAAMNNWNYAAYFLEKAVEALEHMDT